MASIPNPFVFREYDVRGVADRDLSDDFALSLGRALGTFWARRGQRRVAVGRDCRLSSPRLHAALVRGILETGAQITDVGMVPTPLLYFSVFHLGLDGGVQITGSHNPPEDNGFKIMSGKGTLSGEEILELRRIIEQDDFAIIGERAIGAPGTRTELDILPAYEGFVRGNVKMARTDLRFAIDAGNGAGGPAALGAMRAAGLEPIALLCEPDGAFPVHHPDPSLPENLEMLVATVRELGLELGIAFDGDADRIGVIDARGDTLWGDKLMIVFARDVLARRPGAAILGEVKCSQTLYDDVAKHGGRPILWKTGHSLIKKKMKEEHALLAGEMSGHVFFADRYFGYDDAIYAALRLLEIVARSDRPLHELLHDVPKTFATPEIRVDCADDRKFGIVERVRDHYRKTHDVIDVDGARILFGEGAWGLVRASNTQPVLVLRFEAGTPERLDAIQREVEALVAQTKEG
ncbi:phosphomannomutase/phosphoglucomutase [Sandaracinus amylolyticus]|uniref:phosphomannomutase/phosphoglucomutase n=1 Tax=Sandaracinus amylolyticus TaxID=927083 RepID=UPI001F4827CC|nr:phosphomannomutase/phosphoglucomutase [Sandaracinus amylolyticus]UJR80694.1 Phosphomannomutase / phosphoglucomutase / phosphoglucosamine mutase [Sandaracinus amylolyticus]